MPVPAIVLSLPFALSQVFGGNVATVLPLEPAASVIVCVKTPHVVGDFFGEGKPFTVIDRRCNFKTTRAAFEI